MSDLREEIAEYCFWSEWPEQVADEIIAKVQDKTIERVLAAVEARRDGYKALHNNTAVAVCGHLTRVIKEINDESLTRSASR